MRLVLVFEGRLLSCVPLLEGVCCHVSYVICILYGHIKSAQKTDRKTDRESDRESDRVRVEFLKKKSLKCKIKL